MSNDFVYDMSEINEEDMFKAWEEMVAEDGNIWETGYDDEWLDDFQGEEEFAQGIHPPLVVHTRRKPLLPKDLRRVFGRIFDVSAYAATTYDK